MSHLVCKGRVGHQRFGRQQGGLGRQQTQLFCLEDGLHPTVDIQLAVDVVGMDAESIGGQVQFLSYLAVGEAAGQ